MLVIESEKFSLYVQPSHGVWTFIVNSRSLGTTTTGYISWIDSNTSKHILDTGQHAVVRPPDHQEHTRLHDVWDWQNQVS
jgi:hypothetical protein